MDNKTLVAPGVTRHECGWGYYLQGSKAALLTSGLAKQDWFADGTERDKGGRCIRSRRLVEGGRKIRTNTPKVGSCTVSIHYTGAEQAKMSRERKTGTQRTPSVLNIWTAPSNHKTPFSYRITDSEHCALLASDGKALAVFLASEEQMEFICRACNNFSALAQIARLSRGEVECSDSPYSGASHKAMQQLFGRLDCELLHG